ICAGCRHVCVCVCVCVCVPVSRGFCSSWCCVVRPVPGSGLCFADGRGGMGAESSHTPRTVQTHTLFSSLFLPGLFSLSLSSLSLQWFPKCGPGLQGLGRACVACVCVCVQVCVCVCPSVCVCACVCVCLWL